MERKINATLKAFTITVFIILASIDNSVLDMASSVYWAIRDELLIEPEFLGLVNSILIWIVASMAIAWGYLGDRGNRKRLLLIGTLIWSGSLVFTPLVQDGTGWLACQVVAGVGLGCIASVGFSVISDFISPEKRGIAMSFWGLSQGIGTGIGKALAAIIVTDASRWWEPFFYVSLAGFAMVVLYFFTLDPKRGATEAELKDVDYDYRIRPADLVLILKKPTNLALLFQGLTAQVVWGSITWLPFVFTTKVASQGILPGTAGLVGNLIAGLFAIGGIFSILFGSIGDKLQKRTLKARPLISTIGVFAGIPLFIVMVTIPFDVSALAGIDSVLDVVGALLSQLLMNGPFLLMFMCALGAAAMMAADSPNWFALISDVNLPEHRGTVFGLGNFISGIGRGIGSLILPIISVAFTAIYPEPDNFIWSLAVVQLFFLPTGVCYLVACFYVEKDLKDMKKVLADRAEQAKSRLRESAGS